MTIKNITELNFKRLGKQLPHVEGNYIKINVEIPSFDLNPFLSSSLQTLLIKLDEELNSLINEFVCSETKHLRTWQKSYILNSYNLNFDIKHDWNMAIELSPSFPIDPYRYEVNLYKDFEYQNTIAVFKKDHVSNTEVTDK